MKMSELHLPAGISLTRGDSARLLADALAADVSEKLREALTLKDRALLVVSGGSTPIPFFEVLRDKKLDWSRVDVTLADERWVPEDHADSNTRLVKAHLLKGAAAAARWIPLANAAASPEEGLEQSESELAQAQWPIDVLVLGMGNDGHTASLFPGTDGLEAAMNAGKGVTCAAITPLDAPHPRITLTWPVLDQAASTYLLLQGEAKLNTLKKAIEHAEDRLTMPIRAFFRPGLSIFWSA